MHGGHDLLKLYEVVKLVVSDDVRSGANLRSFTQIFGEH